MFDKFFWASLCFEMIVPLVLTTTLFWVIVFPKAVKQTINLARKLANTLYIPPCNTVLQWSLMNVAETRVNIAKLPTATAYKYAIAVNVLVIVIIAMTSLIVPIIFGVGRKHVMYSLGEIIAIYAIVLVGEIYFIKEIAFKYTPGTSEHLYNEIVGRLATDCFDVRVPNVDLTTLPPCQ